MEIWIYADIVIKFLLEKQTILAVVLIFGLVLWTIVTSFVLRDHIVRLPHTKFLAIKGISCNLQESIIDLWESMLLIYIMSPVSDITAGWVQLIKIVSFNQRLILIRFTLSTNQKPLICTTPKVYMIKIKYF